MPLPGKQELNSHSHFSETQQRISSYSPPPAQLHSTTTSPSSTHSPPPQSLPLKHPSNNVEMPHYQKLSGLYSPLSFSQIKPPEKKTDDFPVSRIRSQIHPSSPRIALPPNDFPPKESLSVLNSPSDVVSQTPALTSSLLWQASFSSSSPSPSNLPPKPLTPSVVPTPISNQSDSHSFTRLSSTHLLRENTRPNVNMPKFPSQFSEKPLPCLPKYASVREVFHSVLDTARAQDQKQEMRSKLHERKEQPMTQGERASTPSVDFGFQNSSSFSNPGLEHVLLFEKFIPIKVEEGFDAFSSAPFSTSLTSSRQSSSFSVDKSELSTYLPGSRRVTCRLFKVSSFASLNTFKHVSKCSIDKIRQVHADAVLHVRNSSEADLSSLARQDYEELRPDQFLDGMRTRDEDKKETSHPSFSPSSLTFSTLFSQFFAHHKVANDIFHSSPQVQPETRIDTDLQTEEVHQDTKDVSFNHYGEIVSNTSLYPSQSSSSSTTASSRDFRLDDEDALLLHFINEDDPSSLIYCPIVRSSFQAAMKEQDLVVFWEELPVFIIKLLESVHSTLPSSTYGSSTTPSPLSALSSSFFSLHLHHSLPPVSRTLSPSLSHSASNPHVPLSIVFVESNEFKRIRHLALPTYFADARDITVFLNSRVSFLSTSLFASAARADVLFEALCASEKFLQTSLQRGDVIRGLEKQSLTTLSTAFNERIDAIETTSTSKIEELTQCFQAEKDEFTAALAASVKQVQNLESQVEALTLREKEESLKYTSLSATHLVLENRSKEHQVDHERAERRIAALLTKASEDEKRIELLVQELTAAKEQSRDHTVALAETATKTSLAQAALLRAEGEIQQLREALHAHREANENYHVRLGEAFQEIEAGAEAFVQLQSQLAVAKADKVKGREKARELHARATRALSRRKELAEHAIVKADEALAKYTDELVEKEALKEENELLQKHYDQLVHWVLSGAMSRQTLKEGLHSPSSGSLVPKLSREVNHERTTSIGDPDSQHYARGTFKNQNTIDPVEVTKKMAGELQRLRTRLREDSASRRRLLTQKLSLSTLSLSQDKHSHHVPHAEDENEENGKDSLLLPGVDSFFGTLSKDDGQDLPERTNESALLNQTRSDTTFDLNFTNDFSELGLGVHSTSIEPHSQNPSQTPLTRQPRAKDKNWTLPSPTSSGSASSDTIRDSIAALYPVIATASSLTLDSLPTLKNDHKSTTPSKHQNTSSSKKHVSPSSGATTKSDSSDFASSGVITQSLATSPSGFRNHNSSSTAGFTPNMDQIQQKHSNLTQEIESILRTGTSPSTLTTSKMSQTSGKLSLGSHLGPTANFLEGESTFGLDFDLASLASDNSLAALAPQAFRARSPDTSHVIRSRASSPAVKVKIGEVNMNNMLPSSERDAPLAARQKFATSFDKELLPSAYY